MIARAALMSAVLLVGCADDAAGPIDVVVATDTLGRLLAATPPEGRIPGTNQAIATLVRDELAAVGVTDLAIEEFSIPVSASTSHSLELAGGVTGAREHVVNVFGGDGMVASTSVVDVGLSAQPDPTAAGKVAMFDFSVTRSLRAQYRNVIAAGAVAVIIDAKLDTLRQRNVWTLAGAASIDGPIPVVTIDQRDAAAVREQLAQGADVRAAIATDAGVTTKSAYNVIARIPGTTYPDRTLLVNAHLDSWFAGAADNGQSVAALVALAKALVAEPLPYTVELVAFDCEETFLLGSNNYLRRRLPGVRDTLIGSIALEMLAPKNADLSLVTIDPKDVWLPAIEAGGLTKLFRATLTPADQMTAFGGEVPSDQGNFWQFGVPGFYVATTYEEYHSALDDAQNTDEARFEDVLVALHETLRQVGAQPPEMWSMRPLSSIDVRPAITDRAPNRLTGAVAATNAQSGVPVEDAVVTVTAFTDGYDQVLASAPATLVPGTGYTFTIDYRFATGTPYVLSVDASVAGKAAGRALLRLE